MGYFVKSLNSAYEHAEAYKKSGYRGTIKVKKVRGGYMVNVDSLRRRLTK